MSSADRNGCHSTTIVFPLPPGEVPGEAIMQTFDHIRASDARDALARLGQGMESRIIAGGTDLLPLMKEGLLAPVRLVDLKPARALRYLRIEADGALRMGALTTLADIERSPEVAARHPILVQAVRDAATPQLRALASIGGNLLQRPRCWYFRGQFDCWLKGGADCFARDGQNQYSAIFDGGQCVAVHPSDLAPALVALEASLTLQGPSSSRTLPVADLFASPEEYRRVEHRLGADELITEIVVPRQPDGTRGVYLKMMERQAWAFALVSAAAALTLREGRVERARLVLGGVANIPRRALAAEQALEGQMLTPELVAQAAERAVAAAQPLQHNGYKVPMARELMRRAILQAADLPF